MDTLVETDWLELADAPAIDGLRFRRLRGADADYEAMAALIAEANLHDGHPWLPTAKLLRDGLESSVGVHPATDLVITEIDGRPVAESGVERVMRDGVAVYEIWGTVRPDVRRRGLGRALLRENLRRAAERSVGEPAGQAFDVRSQASEREAGHRALLERNGFEPIRWFFDMRRPTLDDIPEAPLPDGLEIRPITADQHRAIFDAERDAFRDHWSAREQTDGDFKLTYSRPELDTGLWVVAWEGDAIAGVVQSWIWAEENLTLGANRGWLEHISVRRAWRRRGLGRALTAEALRRLAAAGMTEAMLGVDAENPTGALGLYQGLGFEVDQRSTTYRRSLGD
jgi:mycothiol synthase